MATARPASLPAALLDEKIEPLYEAVVRRNPGEAEFHQAVHGVLGSRADSADLISKEHT